jgi:hypothetical protein
MSEQITRVTKFYLCGAAHSMPFGGALAPRPIALPGYPSPPSPFPAQRSSCGGAAHQETRRAANIGAPAPKQTSNEISLNVRYRTDKGRSWTQDAVSSSTRVAVAWFAPSVLGGFFCLRYFTRKRSWAQRARLVHVDATTLLRSSPPLRDDDEVGFRRGCRHPRPSAVSDRGCMETAVVAATRPRRRAG